jgi:hypothetical protein
LPKLSRKHCYEYPPTGGYDTSVLGETADAARGGLSLTRLLWATVPDPAIGQTYSKVLPPGLLLDAQPDFRVRAILDHDGAGHYCRSAARVGPVPKGDSLRRAGFDRFGLRRPLLGQPRLPWRPAQCTARQCECGRSRQCRTVGVGGCVFRGQQLALRSGDIGDRTDSVAIGRKGCIERGS